MIGECISELHGVTIERIEDGEYGIEQYRVETPFGTQEFESQQQAKDFRALYFAVDGFRMENVGERGIPLDVAVAGRAAIAMYLLTVWGDSPNHVAKYMDVERKTIYEYRSRIRTQASEYNPETTTASHP